MCKHRRMSSHDDPEARIRDLERSLSEQSSELTQSSSEMGSAAYEGGYRPPPPHTAPQSPYTAPQSPYTVPQSPYTVPQQAYGDQAPYGAPFPSVTMTSTGGGGRGWIAYGVMAAVLVAIIGGTILFFAHAFSSVTSIVDTFGDGPTASGGGGPFDAPPSRSGGNRPPAPTIAPSVAPSAPVGPVGGEVSVAGVGGNKTIVCNDSVVNISGVSNTIVITGQCASVTVSGVENTVSVESSVAISASGFSNRVTYLSGTPEINNSGDSNVVEQG